MPVIGTSAWLMVLASGGLTVGGYFFMMYGINKLGAATASFVSMLKSVISVVFGTIWFYDLVTLGVVAGGLLIFCSILLIAVYLKDFFIPIRA